MNEPTIEEVISRMDKKNPRGSPELEQLQAIAKRHAEERQVLEECVEALGALIPCVSACLWETMVNAKAAVNKARALGIGQGATGSSREGEITE